MMKIPDTVAKWDLKPLRKPTEKILNDQPDRIPDPKNQPKEQDLSGTISDQLTDNASKRKPFPQMALQPTKKIIKPDITETENRWSILSQNNQQEELQDDSNRMDSHHQQLLSQYDQKTVSSNSQMEGMEIEDNNTHNTTSGQSNTQHGF